MAKLPPIHPGEVLLHDFIEELGISQYRLAKSIDVPPRRINEIIHGTRAITADTALRLARYFGNSPRFWLNLQAQHDLNAKADELGDSLDHIVAAGARPLAWTSKAMGARGDLDDRNAVQSLLDDG